ncbi:DUF417 family protein [Mucilaginibacter sabulilitoris]|uniref:DUF417 family protein n=1 Tax=Mucilaginibacter sabulilitoris TaxID=1173583 RepID=A0ABZ0TP62_9SPHI|nr:DUF417 family protein [Mucilaginibacter sabulilitoris]WPU92965.1 DUF417 family protein [Mucilaginibacter sabulilitoris]
MKLLKLAKWLDEKNVAFIVSSIGIAIILLWIGTTKFTPTESNGIAGLVKNSPLMSWMYHIFSINTTSAIIGVLEILAALAILAGNFSPRVGIWGSMLCVVIFFVTSTFFLTTPDTVTMFDGVYAPSGTGSFLIKDISILGASLFLLSHFAKKTLESGN